MLEQSRNFVGKKIDDYVLVDILGTGAFGQVFAAQNLVSKETVAIKSVPRTKLVLHNGMVGQLLKTEVSILMSCNNMNVVKMMKYLESENNCYIVMEYCNQGDLEQLWKTRNRKFPESEAIQYLKQILNGMRGLHEMNVIHRDLKLPNIMISNNTLKIGDLGFAKRLEDKEALVKDALGTLGTMAPEVIEFKPYGMLADIFSLGAIYYQMMFGILPFSIKSYEDFLSDVKRNPPNFHRDGVQISEQSKDLLQKMLRCNPKERITWSQLYEHPLFIDQKQGIQSVNQKLTVQHIAAKQVDLKQNREVYELKKDQFEQLTDGNMIANIQRQAQDIQMKKVDDKEPLSTDQQLLIHAKQQRELIKQKDDVMNYTLELYLGERNTLIFLGTLLHEIHTFQHSQQTNVFLPAFMIVKKQLIEMDNLKTKIKKQENIFNCKFFMELYMHPQFIQFQRLLDEDFKVIQDYFNVIMSQLSLIFDRMPQPNELLVKELNPQPSPDFMMSFRDALLNYYFQLQEEKERVNDQFKNKINNLLIYVLDAIAYDKHTKLMLRTRQVDEYFEHFNFMDDKEKDELISTKFILAYS